MEENAPSLRLSPRSIYFMLSWAEDFYDPRDGIFVGSSRYESPEDLFLDALSSAASRIHRQGADREYRENEYVGTGVRGRLDMDRTLQIDRGRCRVAVSVVSDLSSDCPQNNAIRSALLFTSRISAIRPDIRERARLRAKTFPGRYCITRADALKQVRSAQIHRNNAGYRKALFLARLLLESARPSGGQLKFYDPFDTEKLNRVFEKFLLNFFSRCFRDSLQVGSERLRWSDDSYGPSSLLPEMRTDITIRSPHRCMVIDAKVYANPFTEHRGKKALHSAHLYQISSYCGVSRAADPQVRPWAGALIYACAGTSFEYTYDLRGTSLMVLGLDLEENPSAILTRLRRLWYADDSETNEK